MGRKISGFNEAEAIKPRNRTRAAIRPPGEPGFNEAEAIKPRNPPAYLGADGGFLRASMRPRQSSLGISILRRFQLRDDPASMRPRQSSLGISAASGTPRLMVVAMLQ